jgi:hypothetical protein
MRRRILVSVIERAIRVVAVVASAIVLISFGLFAIDQARAGSKREQDRLAQQDTADPTAAQERQREKAHSGIRERLDDADDFLLQPFTGIVDSGNEWAQRGVPTVIALVVYGFGLGFVARIARGR